MSVRSTTPCSRCQTLRRRRTDLVPLLEFFATGDGTMIVLPRSLARQFRALLRRCLQPPGPRQPPIVRLHVGPHGLEMVAHQQECVIVYQQPGQHTRETPFCPADVLADIEGKDGSATLETISEGQGEARWDDAGVPRCRPFDTVKPDRMPEVAAMPKHFQPLEPAFLHALAEAA